MLEDLGTSRAFQECDGAYRVSSEVPLQAWPRRHLAWGLLAVGAVFAFAAACSVRTSGRGGYVGIPLVLDSSPRRVASWQARTGLVLLRSSRRGSPSFRGRRD